MKRKLLGWLALLTLLVGIPATLQAAVNDAFTITTPNTQNTQISVKSFGAVGNGIIDDTAAIQAAIDSVEAAGHKEVITNYWPSLYFPGGIYLVTGLTINKPITLYGESKTSSILKTTTNASLITIDLTGSTSLRAEYQGTIIKDLGLLGSGTGVNQNGINISQYSSVYEIDNCNIGYFGNDGVLFNGGAELRIDKSWFASCTNSGIHIIGATLAGTTGYANGVWVTNNMIRRNGIGILTENRVLAMVIEKNIIESNAAGTGDIGSATRPSIGIKVVRDPGTTNGNFGLCNSAIRDNYFENHYQDINIAVMTDCVIDHNYFDGNQVWAATYAVSSSAGQYGHIVLTTAPTASYNNLITNNSISLKDITITAGNWSVASDKQIYITAATNLSTLVRYKTKAYVMCGTLGANRAVSNATYSGGKITLTVNSTAGLDEAQHLLLFVAQVTGADGNSYRNRFINNTFTLAATFKYTDPENVYDGQCIPVAARGMRSGMRANSKMGVESGTFSEKGSGRALVGLPSYENNGAAKNAGLVPGDLYLSKNADPRVICVVY